MKCLFSCLHAPNVTSLILQNILSVRVASVKDRKKATPANFEDSSKANIGPPSTVTITTQVRSQSNIDAIASTIHILLAHRSSLNGNHHVAKVASDNFMTIKKMVKGPPRLFS
jgi:hypothetical protein